MLKTKRVIFLDRNKVHYEKTVFKVEQILLLVLGTKTEVKILLKQKKKKLGKRSYPLLQEYKKRVTFTMVSIYNND